MNLILFDDQSRETLLPLTFTRPAAGLRVGILTIQEKWEKRTGLSASHLTAEYLSGKFPMETAEDNLLVNGALLPDPDLVDRILGLSPGEGLQKDGTILGFRISGAVSKKVSDHSFNAVEYPGDAHLVDYPWKIFLLNGQEIATDMELLTAGRKSASLSSTVNVLGKENIFVEADFTAEYITINASSGPVYLGAGSEIMEGSVIRGPFALCEQSTVKLASKIYGPTTIGPHSKAGGEINNSIILGYSNKGHDGFLGQAVIGEWCNLGADTNNSNLKNNYTEVKMWSYPANRFIKTGLQFCGLVMGDHSKCGINTMFNTGTVVGVSANIYGEGFPRNFIPSFSWGGAHGMMVYRLDKAIETAERVMERRNIQLTEDDRLILNHIFETTEKYRKFT
jgi:UDP-N-acetylglucosamine diphosphorylase/glucosamine-1-phosphate N-acetyltransferase